MKMDELRGKTRDQLLDMVAAMKKEMLNLRFQAVTGDAPGPSRKRELRRGVARINTLLTQLKSDKR